MGMAGVPRQVTGICGGQLVRKIVEYPDLSPPSSAKDAGIQRAE
jgi:hypothetical protein